MGAYEREVGAAGESGYEQGQLGGTLGGAAAGAAIGSVLPGVGTLVGAGIGAMVGGAGGGLLGGLFGGKKEARKQKAKAKAAARRRIQRRHKLKKAKGASAEAQMRAGQERADRAAISRSERGMVDPGVQEAVGGMAVNTEIGTGQFDNWETSRFG